MIVDFMTDHFDRQFAFFSDWLEWLISGLITCLDKIPPLGLILIIAGLAYFFHRKWKLAVGVACALI